MANSIEEMPNIKEMKFDVTLENLKNFKEFRSNVFYIQGYPWTVKIRKENKELCFALWSESEKINIKNNIIMASLSAKFLSSAFNKDEPDVYLCPIAFDSTKINSGPSISYTSLMDPKNGFVQNDKCRLEISIGAMSQFNTLQNEWMSFETVEKSCGSISSAKYRLTIKNINEFYAGCSPKFILNDMQWQIGMFRQKKQNDYTIDLLLCNFDFLRKLGKKCAIKYAYKTTSSDKDIVCITNNGKLQLNNSNGMANWYVAHWKQQNDFSDVNLEDRSLTVEFEIKIEEVDGLHEIIKKRKIDQDNKENNGLECSICGEKLFNRPTSSLVCGHMFCTECIEKALEYNKSCPICYQRATVDQLRSLYNP